jgi:N-sulfoglucosamine sulfohydrolase
MPSRNVMWSGRYPHNNGVEGFYQVPNPGYPVLVDLVKQAGYFTAIYHKVSHSTPYHPYDWDLVLGTLPDGTRAHVKDPVSYGVSTSQGIQAADQADKPFCLMINIADPHKPFHAENNRGETIPDPHTPSRVFTPDEVPIPGFLFDDPVVSKELAHYYSSVRRADDAVDQILKALEASGHADRTVVVFLSDHGMPLPFAKTQLYHHSTHTPLIFRWPGVVPPGSVDDRHMVSAVDLLPTLLDVLDIPHPPGFDGRSFAPLLQGGQQDGRDLVFKVYNENSGGSRDPMRAIQTKQYLYLFNPWSNGTRVMATATNGTPTYRRMAELAQTAPQLAARHALYQHRVVEELYDVQRDPDCLVNLIDAPEHQQQLTRLRELLERRWPIRRIQCSRCSASATIRSRAKTMCWKNAVNPTSAASRRSKTKKKEASAPKSPKRNDLISLDIPETIVAGQPLTVQVRHQLEDELGQQLVHVTLKVGPEAVRAQRHVVTVAGRGVTDVTFDIPPACRATASVSPRLSETTTPATCNTCRPHSSRFSHETYHSPVRPGSVWWHSSCCRRRPAGFSAAGVALARSERVACGRFGSSLDHACRTNRADRHAPATTRRWTG